MLEEALVALAAAGGTAVVQAAGTDAWIGFRTRMAKLLGRGDAQRERAELARLDQTAATLEAAAPPDAERLRVRHEASWQARIEILLDELAIDERTRAAADLRDIVHSLGVPIGSVSAGAGGLAVGGNLQISATGDGSIAAGIVNGTAIGSYHAAPDATDPGKKQKAAEMEHARRQAAAVNAAYNRFISTIPRPGFSQVEWRELPRHKSRMNRLLYPEAKFEPASPGYSASLVNGILQYIRTHTSSTKGLHELGAFLATLTRQGWEVGSAPTAYKQTAYPVSEVDQYLAELGECLGVFFSEVAQE